MVRAFVCVHKHEQDIERIAISAAFLRSPKLLCIALDEMES